MKQTSILLLLLILTSCNTSKQAISYENVKNGKELESVPIMTFDSFVNAWGFNRKIQKIDLNIREIYKDNHFTYFGSPNPGITKPEWTIFKVHSDTIISLFPNYTEFYGSELKDFLWSEVIPKEDVELWNHNRTKQQNQFKPQCQYKKNKPIHLFSLSNKKVILTMKWEFECDELKSLNNKTYQASYNLLTKQFERIIN